MSHRQPFLNIRTEGALLPSDILSRLMEGINLPGLKPEDYHLGAGEKLNEAISRSWTRLLSLWLSFRKAAAALPATDLGTTLTRERWLLQLFQELGYGRLIGASPVEIEGKTYPISHIWQGQYYQVPIHLVSFRADLNKRSEQRIQGASKASPHGMVQEFLNRTDRHLWGLVSNGLKLLILRDNASLTRQAYVEFDLEGIFEGEAYADFRLLWLVCHQSRLEGTAKDRPETCWLEVWSKQAQTDGRRALDQLRVGVEKALESLGTGFISHKANAALCQRLKAGELNKQDLYRQLLRLVYRLIFLFVAEDRDLLHYPGASDEARSRYARFYSGQRLRRMAERTRGSRHADLWVALRLVFNRLGDDRGCPELGLPALGGFLFGPQAMPDLESAELSNEHLLLAIRNLGLVKDRSGWRLVDYRNLGSEELGSVYESLLELNPSMELDAGVFSLSTVAGNQRKTSGSYYTPDSLVQCLLDSALDPVVEQAVKGKTPAEAEKAILALKVCDPAVGSGHFLVGAAHRLAKHLAQVRAQVHGESEPSPLYYQAALRDVIGHSLYGVDINPMAAELCRVSLWLEAIEPGKPLSFLDHHIRVGNSLLGATPALLAKGIPDEAFTPIEGDDKEVCKRFKKVNKDERAGFRRLFAATTEPWERLGDLAASMTRLDDAPDDSIEAVREKQRMYEAMVRSGGYLDGQFWADTWCAAFVWKKTDEFPYPITEEVFRRIEHNPHAVDSWMRDEIARLAQQYQFFHWHLAFPDVFHMPAAEQKAQNEQTGWNGGFDLVLGNPPWERIKIQEKEWFAERRPDIAKAANAAARKRAIQALKQEDSVLWTAWQEALRASDGEATLVRATGRFPLCGRGDTNTFSVFAEANLQLISAAGRAGFIVPSGIATDDTTKFFFQEIVESQSIVSLFDFQSGPGLFSEIGHARFKFSLLTLAGRRMDAPPARFAFFLRSLEELQDAERSFELSAHDISLLNPNTRTCPIFRTCHDAELTKAIYRRVPVLIDEVKAETGNPWALSFLRMMDMATDSSTFRTAPQMLADDFILQGNIFEHDGLRYVPLYEAKMVHQFDHRFGDYAYKEADDEGTALPQVPSSRLQDADYAVQPRYWVPKETVEERLRNRWDRCWLLGWRDICRSTDERTTICAVIPSYGVGDKFLLMFPAESTTGTVLCANLNAFAFDYSARQKIGGTSFKYFTMRQTPVLPPGLIMGLCAWSTNERVREWAAIRILELAYTAWDLRPFAQDCGWSGPPFRWDEERRFLLRCELDAAFFHLYLPSEPDGEWSPCANETAEDRARLKASFATPRDAVAYIMDTFPIVKRKDEEKWGEYRTKRVILEIYDAMAEAMRTGVPYQTRLDPPPADPRCCHPPRGVVNTEGPEN